ncbi:MULTISPECIES: HAD family hydrolase [unclassified Actinoplanes]|uniref:HAD family hydrolase n=1 Tax=unclassified Actinoplanes TaxID=2626549 RepID=UPI001E63CEF1|nr:MULTISPECIES: haloacid dehalogenase-like hydrolase [unclassified Actinoplanes]
MVWDIDGTLIPADLRWLRRAIARAYGLAEAEVRFPAKKVHGYTDESIAIDTAIASGVTPALAEAGIADFSTSLMSVMNEGRDELRSDQPPYPGAVGSIGELNRAGFTQTVLTGNIRPATEVKLGELGLDAYLDLDIGAFGSDSRDRFNLPAVVARRFANAFGRQLVPARTVIIGDAPNDIACARHAGFKVIVVAHRSTREELAEYGPDAIVEDLEPSTIVATVESVLSGGSAS